MHVRSPARRLGARLFCAGVLSLQLYCVLHAYRDPLKRFGFQPFAESSTWSARIVRVDAHGRRKSIERGFSGYRWQTLVEEHVGSPFKLQHASSGVNAMLYFMQRALDYVASHTPNDTTTRYLEAEVSYRRNRGALQQAILRSEERALP